MSADTPKLSPLKQALLAIDRLQLRIKELEAGDKEPVAVVGLGCRFPGGAETPAQFWQLLQDGVDAVREVPKDRWDLDDCFDADPDAPGKVNSRWGGFLDRVDQFDPEFFGITEREADRMDPQQRMLLQTTVEALESAGIPLNSLRGSRVGVFVGAISSSSDYQKLQFDDPTSVDLYTATGTAHSILANRLSYLMDWQGPSLTVDTACSSSLVAIHLAFRSLRSGESSLAVAGGVNLLLSPESTKAISRLHMMAKDGRCKTFDTRADGFVRAEGCGVLILKRLSDAVRDGDRVLATIRGTASNQDGATNGITAPNGLAQQRVVQDALQDAGVAPGSIGLVETHGTGTELGDPIEVEALSEILGRKGDGDCVLGAVKSNVGHLESAAGVIGVMKAVLCLQHGVIPPNLHFTKLNPHIDLDGTRFALPQKSTPWPEGHARKRAGVSSMGFGGTNAHIVLEDWVPEERVTEDRPVEQVSPSLAWLTLSGRDAEELQGRAEQIRSFLQQRRPDQDWEGLCRTAAARRDHQDHRLGVLSDNAAAAVTALEEWLSSSRSGDVLHGIAKTGVEDGIAFVYSGQGAHWPDMGRELLAEQPVFRSAVEQVDALFRPLAGWSTAELMSAGDPDSRLEQTEVAQPCLFALQVGLTELLRSWGVEPRAVAGHSVGEIAAGWAAGCLPLESAVRIVFERSKLMQEATGTGRMLATGWTPDQAETALANLADKLSIAGYNGPQATMISGDATELERIADALKQQKIFHKWLPVDYAFHSPQMQPFCDRLQKALKDLPRPSAGSCAWYSTVEAGRMDGAKADAGYWARNMRQPVRFLQTMQAMVADRFEVCIELGPHPSMASPMAQILEEIPGAVFLGTMERDRPARKSCRKALAKLLTIGCDLNWPSIYRSGPPVEIPPRRWRNRRYWLPESQRKDGIAGVATGHPLLGLRLQSPIPEFVPDWGAEACDYLGDHRLLEREVLPFAAIVEMFRAAVVAEGHSGRLYDIAVHEAIFEPRDAGWRFRTVIENSGMDAAVVRLYGAAEADGSWRCLAEAALNGMAPDSTFEPTTDGAADLPSADGFYDSLAEAGADFGAAFRTIQGLRTEDRHALGAVEFAAARREPTVTMGSKRNRSTAAVYGIHPSMLDGALQTVAAAWGTPGVLWVPVHVESIEIHPTEIEARSGVCRAELRGMPSEAEGILADLVLEAADGATLVELRGLLMRKVDPEAWRLADQAALDRSVLEVRWRLGEELAEVQPGALDPELFAVGAQDGIAEACTALWAQGCDRQPSAYGWNEFEAPLAVALAETGTSRPLELMLFAPTDQDPIGAEGAVSWFERMIQAMQQIHRADAPREIRITCVTSRASSAGSALEHPQSALPSGMLRSLRREKPQWILRSVDLEPMPPATAARVLLREARANDREQEVAYRGSARLVPRLVRRRTPRSTDEAPTQLKIAERGVLENLAYRPSSDRNPGDREIQVAVHATGINFRDVLNALGMYPGEAGALGDECAGVVVKAGKDSDLVPGDRVFGMTSGSFATRTVCDARCMARIPAEMGFEEAATLPITFLTAQYALQELGGMASGERVLIHAGAGGVGMAAIQLAQRAGAEIFATAGSDEKRLRLRELGVQHVFDSRSLSFATEILEATDGAGVQLILNSLADEFIDKSFEVLAKGGRFLEIGKTGIRTAEQVREERPDASYHIVYLGDVARDQPAKIRSMLDALIPGWVDGSLSPLPHRVFEREETVDAFRTMAQARHFGKLVIRNDSAYAPCREPQPGGTHLISGGRGDLGRALAEHLAQSGAGRLVLASRSEPSKETVAWAEDLGKRTHVQIDCPLLDVTDRPALVDYLTGIEQAGPPLTAVYHLAAEMRDRELVDQSLEDVRRVLAPKIRGAQLLHDCTQGLRLDRFVMFGASATWVGNPRQAVYAAANGYLDALAHRRTRLGQPALAVDWGLWGEAGMAAADERIIQNLRSQGFTAIATQDGLQLLDRLASHSGAQAVVLPMDWDRFLEQFPVDGRPPLFDELLRHDTDADSDRARSSEILRRELSTLPRAQGIKRLRSLLREEAAKVLSCSGADEVSQATPLRQLGLDSLLSVELRNSLVGMLGKSLPTTLLFDHPTINELVDYLAVEVLGWEKVSDESGPAEMDEEEISDEEAERLLLAELASLKTER